MQTLITYTIWVQTNWAAILTTILTVIGGASMIVKALEKLASLLCTLFPWMRNVDGDLQHAAAFLDSLSQAKWLNTVAMNPSKKE